MSKKIFRQRAPEWFLALLLTFWGLTLFFIEDNTLKYYSSILLIMPLQIWATLATGFGITRLLFLYINGAWKSSAHMRIIGSMFGCVTWGSLVITSIIPHITPISVIYVALLSLDFLFLYYASEDASEADIIANRGFKRR